MYRIGLSKNHHFSTPFDHLQLVYIYIYINMSTTTSGKLIIHLIKYDFFCFILDIERINHLEWRLKRLENFIGNSNQSDKKRV